MFLSPNKLLATTYVGKNVNNSAISRRSSPRNQTSSKKDRVQNKTKFQSAKVPQNIPPTARGHDTRILLSKTRVWWANTPACLDYKRQIPAVRFPCFFFGRLLDCESKTDRRILTSRAYQRLEEEQKPKT